MDAMTNRNIRGVRVKWIRVLKRGMCIKFESRRICIAGNQCDNIHLDIHIAEDKIEAACVHTVFQ